MAMTVSGAIRIGEAKRASFRSAQRASGQSWLWLIALVAAMLATYGVAVALAWGLQTYLGAADYVTPIALLAAVIVNLIVVFPIYRRLARRRFARRLRAGGLVDPVPCTVSVDAAAFTYAIGDVTNTVRWPGVTDLFPVGRFWVVVVQGGRCFVPKRFFGGQDEERAWVADMLGHMGEAARARAKGAERFVAQG